LAAENNWLEFKSFGSGPAVAQEVKKILANPALADFLSVLEAHNDHRSSPFLLGPYLAHIIHSSEARKESVQRMPALKRRPSELRAYYHNASKSAKNLARLLRKVPQPSVALSAPDEVREALSLFQPFSVIQSRNPCDAIVPLDQLLDEAAALLEAITARIPNASQHRKGTERLRLRHVAASVLAAKFRQELDQPYHSHVATIVTLLSGVTTDEDYVKKISRRGRRAATRRGQLQ
jgi:hypothetical protein